MAKRVGHTSDLEVAKWEIEQLFKNTRNWQSTPEFIKKEDAMAWEAKAAEELNCKAVVLKSKKKAQRIVWYGFVFEHDGPK